MSFMFKPALFLSKTTQGMIFAMIAFFMFAFMQVFAKLLSTHHHVIEIAFYRNFIATLPFLFMIFFMKRHDIVVIQHQPKGVYLRAILGLLSLIVTFAAFAALPMAETTAFLFTSSLIIPIMSIFFLNEKVGAYRWSAILIGFIGVLIMLKPAGAINSLGVILALSAAFMHASLQIILRKLGSSESPLTVTFYFMAIGTVLSALALPFLGTMPSIDSVPFLLGLGGSGVLAQIFLSYAYKNVEAALVTVFNYSGIIWATFFGWIIWQEWPTTMLWIGASIVIASNGFILWRESRRGLVSDARIKAKF